MSTDPKRFLRLPVQGKRPFLTIEKVLAWADAHHGATGRWPNTRSGVIGNLPFEEKWSCIDEALKRGRRGLLGGQTLARLLEEHRGVKPLLSLAGAKRAAEAGRWVREERGGCIATISVELILAWADAHHAATGRWPTALSGPIAGVVGETWSTVNNALRRGRRGLPGPTSLTRFLVEHRGRQARNGPPDLTVEQVLGWAEEFHRAQGRWPRPRDRGEIPGSGGLSWRLIHDLLMYGRRGLPGGTTLCRLLLAQRGPDTRNKPPDLSIPQILEWAEAYHAAHGKWPRTQSGKVAGTASETWFNISLALNNGHRGLPGGTTLCRLLAEHRGVHNPAAARDLTIDEVLRWADEHRAATGDWPANESGAVRGTDGERWSAIDLYLRKGMRGLPGGTTLHRLLDEHRPEGRNRLTLEQIRAWGEAHRAATGRWPGSRSGAVIGAPGQTWRHINAALYKGNRGLPGGMTLTQVFGRPYRRRPAEGWVKLSVPEILAWADAHHAATGRWPSVHSGPVRAAPFPLTWQSVETALMGGWRGLAGGQSLARLLQQERGFQPKMGPQAARARQAKIAELKAARGGRDSRATLSVAQILEAADAYHAAMGCWPDSRSGPITGLPGETWSTVSRALVAGLRGLPGGTTLNALLKQHRGRPGGGRIALSVDLILRWADVYHAAHGCWPDESSGPVAESPRDTWANITGVLARGGRGLAGGTTLRRVLSEHRGVRYHGMGPDLTVAQILAWAEAHHAATGEWPTATSGPVARAPEETWSIIDYALKHGRRGLPGGSSLARLMTEHLPAYSRVLTIEQIVAWGEAHHAASGRWPRSTSGAVSGAPGEKWHNLDMALRSGNRGLPAGLSLTKLFPSREPPAEDGDGGGVG
jgi:hypothetical protein